MEKLNDERPEKKNLRKPKSVSEKEIGMLHRIFQVIIVTLWSSQIIISGVLFLAIIKFIPPLWPFLILYAIWIFGFDKAPDRGGRTIKSFRKLWFWKAFASYFQISLVKTVDLPSDRKYIFGYHPHGIIAVGAAINFGSEATGFSKLFPGLSARLLTLKSNFLIPFYRDIILSLGLCSVSMKSCMAALNSKNVYSNDPSSNRGEGNCLIIVVGGAEESLMARPGTSNLVLKKRLGFIRLAIREGADLVPVFSFGENEIFDQLSNGPGTLLYNVQSKFKRLIGYTFPIFYGRGLLGSKSFGFLPYRHPIVSVVGSPIKVEKNPNPTITEVEKYQELYMEELKRIWNDYKDVYSIDRKSEISIVA